MTSAGPDTAVSAKNFPVAQLYSLRGLAAIDANMIERTVEWGQGLSRPFDGVFVKKLTKDRIGVNIIGVIQSTG